MSNSIHSLAQQLTGKSTLEECNLDEVKRIVQRYPFFAPAQFLLLQKLRQSGLTEEADAQYRKAVLFYPDPLAFDLFISSGKFYDGKIQEPSPAMVNDVPQLAETIPDFRFVAEENGTQTEPLLIEGEETSPLIETPAEVHRGEEETAPEPDEETNLLNASNIEATVDNNGTALQQEEPLPVYTEASNLPEPPSPKTQTAGAVTNQPLTFEPYHTVDYFASQGIKISADEVPKDKLGKQLKSFTEWLKTMKRLPALQTADNPETLVEKGVETMADRSVTGSEVLTEAMAEVWAKQGVPEKALDIYNKLSLHNPSKRDYFAAKIESLKPF